MYTRFTDIFWCCRSEEDSEGNRDICSEMLQMKALERLTSTVSVTMFGECFAALSSQFKSIHEKVWTNESHLCSKRYKVSWRQLSPERPVKHVSVPVLGVRNARGKKKKMRSRLSLFVLFYLVSLQCRSRTLKRWKLVSKSLAHPVRKAAR